MTSIRAPEAPTIAAPADETAWRRLHLLDVDDLTLDEVDQVMTTTDAMKEVLAREVPRVPALRGTTVVTLFYENSTRTRSSFELAGKVLGADVINVAASSSSVTKGESLIDTVKTLRAIGADVLIMRHSRSGAPYLAARHANCSVVNAGDGLHAHPTQALLDLYTMRARLGDVRGRRVVIVGDVLHSRVARSNMWLLTSLGAEVTVCAPPTLIPRGLGQALEGGLPPVHVETTLDRAIEGADVVMALRMQYERMQGGFVPGEREYSRLYQVNERRLARANPNALVLHPGPMNEGIEISHDVAHGLQSQVEEQVANGVAVRMAVLWLVTRVGGRGRA
ncbi:MAG TPA: aspartate carbamoyltransferase catalytic subunit [Dehalococcoidia bacterium]|jgi:aspartate carbamoyltransferase catalytic subunit|nr:aspartate carbamoyltransferase catalytic subunit [Dehalococcoidia bacterium]